MTTDPSLREAALAVLGLADPVSPSEVTRTYRRLAKATHPDTNGSLQLAAGLNFATITHAYRTLTAVTAHPDPAQATPARSPQPTPAATPTPPPPSTTAAAAPAQQIGAWRLLCSDIAVGPPVLVSPPRIRRPTR